MKKITIHTNYLRFYTHSSNSTLLAILYLWQGGDAICACGSELQYTVIKWTFIPQTTNIPLHSFWCVWDEKIKCAYALHAEVNDAVQWLDCNPI